MINTEKQDETPETKIETATKPSRPIPKFRSGDKSRLETLRSLLLLLLLVLILLNIY